jgi:hypothetical protein
VAAAGTVARRAGVYENPEPSALNRFQWIDNTTNPPTIRYPNFLTQMIVRIQPLE